MAVLVALYEAEDQVSNVEGLIPHSSAVVPSQHLLVLSRAEEGNVAHLIELIHGILEGRLGSLLVVRPDPRCPIVEVGREDSLRTIDYEGGHPQALEHRGKLHDPLSTKLVQPVEDPILEAL